MADHEKKENNESNPDLSEKDKKYIEAFKKVICCQKNFRCLNQNLDNMCKAKEGGPAGTIYCMEKDPDKCMFSMTLGFNHICKCPLRNHFMKDLDK